MLIERLQELDKFVESTVSITIWFAKLDSNFSTTFLYEDFKYEIDEDGITLSDYYEHESQTYIPLKEMVEIGFTNHECFCILGENINIDIGIED